MGGLTSGRRFFFSIRHPQTIIQIPVTPLIVTPRRSVRIDVGAQLKLKKAGFHVGALRLL
jgi:hypothetical protein